MVVLSPASLIFLVLILRIKLLKNSSRRHVKKLRRHVNGKHLNVRLKMIGIINFGRLIMITTLLLLFRLV